MLGHWSTLGNQIVAGFKYAWSDAGIRSALFIIAAIDFGANGAFDVGLPTLAHGRFDAGAAGLGILLGAAGVGATAGALAGGMMKRPTRMGWWLIVAALGLVAARFVWTSDLWTVPYLLFWVWLLVLSIRLIRRPNLLEPVAI